MNNIKEFLENLNTKMQESDNLQPDIRLAKDTADRAIRDMGVALSSIRDGVLPDMQKYLDAVSKYSSSFQEYLSLLFKYQDDKHKTPSDVFPGIKNISVVSNASEMKADADKMKSLAEDVKNSAAEIESLEHYIIMNIKNQYQKILMVIQERDAMQDILGKVMDELDSVYDVGFLSRNS